MATTTSMWLWQCHQIGHYRLQCPIFCEFPSGKTGMIHLAGFLFVAEANFTTSLYQCVILTLLASWYIGHWVLNFFDL
jgi:hypothetical protein